MSAGYLGSKCRIQNPLILGKLEWRTLVIQFMQRPVMSLLLKICLRFGEQYVATGSDGASGLKVKADHVVTQVPGRGRGGVFHQRGRESERLNKGVLIYFGSRRWFAHVSCIQIQATGGDDPSFTVSWTHFVTMLEHLNQHQDVNFSWVFVD